MKEINYSTQDNSINIKLQYIVGYPKRRNVYGKTRKKTKRILGWIF